MDVSTPVSPQFWGLNLKAEPNQVKKNFDFFEIFFGPLTHILTEKVDFSSRIRLFDRGCKQIRYLNSEDLYPAQPVAWRGPPVTSVKLSHFTESLLPGN